MMPVHALALAAAAFAARPAAPAAHAAPGAPGSPAALKLEPAFKLPPSDPVFSPDFTLAAQASEKTINVWRTSDGKQVARLDAPLEPPVFTGDDEYQGFYVTGFSQDNRRLAVARQHRVEKKDGYWSVNENTVFVMDLESGAAKPVVSRRKGCRVLDSLQGAAPILCLGASAAFFPDGRRLAVADNGFGAQSLHAKSSKRVSLLETIVADVSGKVELDLNGASAEKGEYYPDEYSGSPGAGYNLVDASGRLVGLLADSSSCEIRDLVSGRHVAFLEGCANTAAVAMNADGLAITNPKNSIGGHEGKTEIWDMETGDLLFTSTAADVFVARAPRADVAYMFFGAEKRVEARDRLLKRVLASGTFADTIYSNPTVSPDGSVLYVRGYTAAMGYRTGLHGKTTAPPHLVVSVAPAPKPVFQAAAPPPAAETPAMDVDAPPASKARLDPDAYAVVIGIEKYRQAGIPAVDYASRDARTVYAYLTRSMGFDARNVVLLTDENATRTDFEKNLGKWLQNRAGPKSRVFVYYAGHGAPNAATGEGYLMPYEADPNYVEDTAYPVSKLYAQLGKLPTKDVTVVLDACFSGQGGRSLIAKGARPLVTVKSEKASGNTVVLAAASSSQISAADPDRKHGLLTEYLLEALHGAADKRGDGRITTQDIYAYVRPAVERAARLQNIEQTPTLSGTPDGRPWITLK